MISFKEYITFLIGHHSIKSSVLEKALASNDPIFDFSCNKSYLKVIFLDNPDHQCDEQPNYRLLTVCVWKEDSYTNQYSNQLDDLVAELDTNKPKIIICGEGGGGKDFFKKKLESKGFKSDVSYTTRGLREKESNLVDYNFVGKDDFESLIHRKLLLQFDVVNDNYYGTTLESFDNNDIFIMTPKGISEIPKFLRKSITVFYINIDQMIRYERLVERFGAVKANQRIDIDKELFKNFKDFDIKITNSDF